MPLLKRPEPPTEALARGQARLLAQISVLGGDTDDAEPAEATDPGHEQDAELASIEPIDGGRYTLGRVFAAGGLGVVRRGHDRRLRRPVAIKELLRDSPEAQRRFALEAAITARLQHPSIVPLYDLVSEGVSRPYYCMKLVDGDNLEAKILATEALAERLRLIEHVIDVADAIAYAHDQQIIHRDIKPANVLVGGFGETVVIDWGLAKDLSGEILTELDLGPEASAQEPGEALDVALAPSMTEAGTIMGTLRYMPPEQARGEAVDARSDVYSLGALLYHVLAGRAPFAGVSRAKLVDHVIRGATEALVELDGAIPAELAAIAERAMAPEPDERYASAAEFGEDLRRFQTGRMVSAHAYSLAEVTRRWLRHHRVALGAGALAVLGSAAVGWVALGEVRAQREAAAEAAASAEAEAERAERAAFEGEILEDSRRAVEVLDLARTPGRELEALARGVELVADHDHDYASVPEPTFRGLTTALGGLIPVAELGTAEQPVFSLGSFSPDGSHMVTLPWPDAETGLELWSTAEGRKLRTLDLAFEGPRQPGQAAFSPDNRLLAIGGSTRCTIVEVETGATLHELEGCAEPRFSVEGSTLYAKVPGEVTEASGIQLYGALGAWSVEGWDARWTAPISGHNFQVLVHPDGQRLIVRHDEVDEEAIEILDASSGARQARLARRVSGGREYMARSPGLMMREHLALSPKGTHLAVTETDVGGHVVVWDLDSGEPTVLDLAGGMARQPVFSANGRELYVGGSALDVWNPSANRQLAMLPAPASVVRSAAGALALSEGEWLDPATARPRQAAPLGRMRTLEASPEGAFVVSINASAGYLWSASDHLALERWTRPEGEYVINYSPAQIVTRDLDNQVRVYDRSKPKAGPSAPVDGPGPVYTLAQASSAASIVARAVKGRAGIDVVDLETGALRCHVPDIDPRRSTVELDPQGKTLAVSVEGRAQLWELERCRQRGSVEVHEPNALLAAEGTGFRFADNGALVVHRSGQIEIHDQAGQRVTIKDGCALHNPWGEAMLSPDGRRVLSWCSSSPSAAETIRIWDVETREVLASIDARDYSSAPVFSADGQRLIFIAGPRELAVVGVEDGREQLRIPTERIDATYTKLRPTASGESVEVYTNASELVVYPITHAGVVEAACRVLARSELRDQSAQLCPA